MGKTLISKYPNTILKNSSKLKIKNAATKFDSDKVELKRAQPNSSENEPPLKKLKTNYECVNKSDISPTPVPNGNEVVLKNGQNFYLHAKDSEKGDIFFEDECKISHFKNILRDLYFNIVEEISLEGLDGITLEALWTRLSYIELTLLMNDNLKEIVWKIIRENSDFQFYQLPEPREKLKIYNHFEHYDVIGVVLETVSQEREIYPVEVITDPKIQGSCSTFYSRIDVSEMVKSKSLKEILQEYGSKMVIVASQNLRRAMLMEDADPLIELQNVEFCILERIGRSRKLGVLTQGAMSISNQFKMDSKSVFHHKKHLIRNCLIEKQFFFIRSQITEQNKTGRLLHLRKFYKKVKSKQLIFLEQIVNILKSQPFYRMPTMLLRKNFENFEHTAKITKSSDFRKFIKYDCVYPYRTIYPNATKAEYLSKDAPKTEKGIRCYELMDPYVNIIANYKNDEDIDSDDEDDEEGEEVIGGTKIYNMELFREVYIHILSKGKDGCTHKEILKFVGVDRNSIRMALKKLVTKNVVHIKRVDVGKQRMLKYYAKHLDHNEVVIFNTIPMEKISTVKEKMKQRQRAAIERSRQKNFDKASSPSMDTVSQKDKNKLDQDKTHIVKCEFFVKKNTVLPVSMNENVPDLCSILTKKIFLLKLSHMVLGDGIFTLRTNLQPYKNNLVMPAAFANFQTHYIKKNNFDYITKLILLKATLDEGVLGEYINSLPSKRKISNNESAFIRDDRLDSKSDKLQYMGRNPIIAYSSKEDNIIKKIIVSTVPERYNYQLNYQMPADMSERVGSRIQIVLDVINENRVFEDIFRLLKVIMKKESQEGYQKKIDRKSLSRILKKLVEEGFIRIYQLVMSDEKITKTQFFVCHPTITYTDSTFETALEQIKFRFFANKISLNCQKEQNNSDQSGRQISTKSDETTIQSPFIECDVLESITQLNEMRTDGFQKSPAGMKFMRSMAKILGLKPKFIRMRICHEVLFFLIYDYKASGKPLTETEVSSLFKSHYIDLSEEDLQNMPEIYFKELSWKMFIPPLPDHKGWPTGWALLCDIILRIPISVFCKLHSVTVKSSELEELLNHPIKRFYLLKDIPLSVRYVVFFKRKYITSILNSINKLAFCGLLQKGPQKSKQKDQAFIYLNRKATLLDTKKSEPGYNKISEQEYPELKFQFNSVNDLDQYWYFMYFISLNTKLNQRPAGLIVTYTDVSAKPALMDTLKCRSAEDAPLKDTGDLPGDKRGAAGVDSSLWTHISNNWFWAKVKRKESSTPVGLGMEREKMSKFSKVPISFKDLHVKSNSNKIYLLNALREGEQSKRDKLLVNVPSKTSKKQQRLIKRIPKRKTARRQYHDLTDRMIRKKNGPNMKVKWSSREDHCLMLCKAGDIFLNPSKIQKQQVYYNVFRDVLHRVCPQSKNKTSRACQRRIKIILSKKYRHLEEEVPNLLKLDEIFNYFFPLITRMLNQKQSGTDKITEAQCITAYVILMAYIFKNEKDVETVLKGSRLDHLSPRNLQYTENNLLENTISLKFTDPLTEDDIKKDVLKTVIHSTLRSRNQPDWTLQLFKIYQKYPDDVIRSAVEDLKSTQTISSKRFEMKRKRLSWQIPFKLSQTYISFQFTTFNLTTALETFKTFLALKENVINETLGFSKEIVESKKYGQLLGISEFYSFWQNLRCNIDLPQYTVILNPDIKDQSELVHTLAVRLRLRLKKMVQENNAEEDQEEQDMSNEQLSARDEEDSVDTRPSILSQNIDQVDSEIIEEVQNNLLDLTTDVGNTETIDRLKNWITDCMERERSPSPDFTKYGGELTEADETDHQLDDNEPDNQSNVRKLYQQGHIPTLDEIKKEMLRPPLPNEDRIIPYITELSDLLNKDSFTEHKIDDETLERLKSHFITQYPQLESVVLDEKDKLQDYYLVDYIMTRLNNEKIWKEVQREMVVEEIQEEVQDLMSQPILEKGGTHEDLFLCNEIMKYVFDKEVYGATGSELKEQFSKHEKNLALITILQLMIDIKILIRVGICTLRFVHYKHQIIWLTETFRLTSEEQTRLRSEENLEESIQKELDQKTIIRIKMAPWIQINGTINPQTLTTWLSSVLSYCVESPKVPFIKLCEKFCYLKPVDVFTLLEFLQELGCVDMMIYEQVKPSLFSSWEPPKLRNANFLDDFKTIVIETNNISMTLLGSFLHDSLDKWQ